MENDREKYHKQKETSNWKVMEWNQVLSEKLSKTRKTCVAFYLMSKSILDIYMYAFFCKFDTRPMFSLTTNST